MAKRRLVTTAIIAEFMRLRGKGFSDTKIGRATGFSQTTVSLYLNNRKTTSLEMIGDNSGKLEPENHLEFGRINRLLMTTMAHWGEVA